MKNGIVWSGKNKKDGELFLERHVKPADSDAVLVQNKEENVWQIKAKRILGSKPVIVDKSK